MGAGSKGTGGMEYLCIEPGYVANESMGVEKSAA